MQTVAVWMLAMAGIFVMPVQASAPTAEMARAAQAFLAALDGEAHATVQFPFDAEERINWHFVPKPRAGLALKRLSADQQRLAMQLLESGLSEKGYTKAETIRALELVLAGIEQNSTSTPSGGTLTAISASTCWSSITGIRCTTGSRTELQASKHEESGRPQQADRGDAAVNTVEAARQSSGR